MTRFSVIDEGVGSEIFAINLIADPTDGVLADLISAQDAVSDRIPEGILYRTPAASLHLSVFQFVWARRTTESAGEIAWSSARDYIVAELESIANSTRKFALQCPSIVVGESALILKFAPCAPLERLRDRISAIASVTGLSWNRPAIQHTTIFRYARRYPVSEISGLCATLRISEFAWRIRGLRLVREDVYPSLNLTTIRRYGFDLE